MTNENVRLMPHDHILAKIILPFIPRSVHPNHVTVFRLILIPFVLLYFWREDWTMAMGLFLLAASTDAIDGSLARTRKQITMWGTMADPLADKLLIGSTVLLFVAREINPWFAAVIVVIELMIVAGAAYNRHLGRYSSANEYGKIKMFLQCLGVILLLVAKILGIELAVPFAIGTFSVAIAFAIVSLLTYGL